MIKKGWIYYKDREKAMQKYDINIPEFPIVPESTIIYIVFDDVTKRCKRYITIAEALLNEEDSV